MKKVLWGFILVVSSLLTSLYAEDKPRAVIIFDASGSMWGQIDGKTKIEIAKDALKNVVEKWNPSVELGLSVYGHRTKGDCNDIETIIPVGKVDKKRVISTVMAIKPKGKTPISRSLRKVANEIKYTEEKATIILISDGKETCDTDPCGTAKELASEGIDFVTHVIGFNVDKKTDKQLECIATVTGGEYFSAKNAVALNRAMSLIVKKVEPKPKSIVKKLKNNLQISASEKEGSRWVKAYHQIYKIVDGEVDERVESCNSYKKEACLEQIPVGEYLIRSTYNKFKKETTFKVTKGELSTIHITLGETGKIQISASQKEGGKWVKAYHQVYKVVDGEIDDRVTSCNSYKKEACLEQIPVGEYLIKSTYNKFKKETPFEIKYGKVTKVHISFSPFYLAVKGINKCTMINHDVISSFGQTVADALSPANRGVSFVLPDGKYTIESTTEGQIKQTKITIGEGENKEATVDFGGEESLGSVDGIWKTSEGKATLTLDGKKVTGVYTTDNGEIIGEMTYPQRFEGYWIEDGSNKRCTETKNGRSHWGKVVWEFDKDMCSFKGNWNYCEEWPSRSWRGTYIKPLPKESSHEELIKADSISSVPVIREETKESLKKIGQLGAVLGEISKVAGDGSAKEIKEVGALFEALGTLGSAKKEPIPQQVSKNKKVDKEFDEMSQELEMYTK